MSHASEPDTARESAKGAAGSVDHELRDGSRVVARGPRSEIMKAARRVSHGATVGRVGGEPEFMWSSTSEGWVFLA